MTFWTLIRRSLRFHARSHLGVVLGAGIGSTCTVDIAVASIFTRSRALQFLL